MHVLIFFPYIFKFNDYLLGKSFSFVKPYGIKKFYFLPLQLCVVVRLSLCGRCLQLAAE